MKRIAYLSVVLACAPLFLFAQVVTTSVPSVENASSTELKLTRTLRKGMSGDDIQALQRALARMPELYAGGKVGKVTGYFDAATELAIKRLQRREGLSTAASKAYGTVGPQTAEKINELLVAM